MQVCRYPWGFHVRSPADDSSVYLVLPDHLRSGDDVRGLPDDRQANVRDTTNGKIFSRVVCTSSSTAEDDLIIFCAAAYRAFQEHRDALAVTKEEDEAFRGEVGTMMRRYIVRQGLGNGGEVYIEGVGYVIKEILATVDE